MRTHTLNGVFRQRGEKKKLTTCIEIVGWLLSWCEGAFWDGLSNLAAEASAVAKMLSCKIIGIVFNIMQITLNAKWGSTLSVGYCKCAMIALEPVLSNRAGQCSPIRLRRNSTHRSTVKPTHYYGYPTELALILRNVHYPFPSI